MKSFELAVNIERVIRSLKNTWTIIKPAWGAPRTSGGGVGGGKGAVGRERDGSQRKTVERRGSETAGRGGGRGRVYGHR